MSQATTQYRTATVEEVATMIDWVAIEGWNPGMHDAEAFFATDPDGFIVAVVEGCPVGAISVVNHSNTFAFLGLYIVRPEFRGRGIGYALWEHGIRHAGSRAIGLDGVPDQQDNYRRSGFVRAGETTRFVGTVKAHHDANIRPATPNDVTNLVTLEGKASGVCKPMYVSAWVKQTTLRQTFVLTLPSGLSFCTIRACCKGEKIGPLVADSQESAAKLISHAATAYSGEIMIDVPAQSTQLAQYCHDIGLRPTFSTARMYRGKSDSVSGDDCLNYAVGTLELG